MSWLSSAGSGASSASSAASTASTAGSAAGAAGSAAGSAGSAMGGASTMGGGVAPQMASNSNMMTQPMSLGNNSNLATAPLDKLGNKGTMMDYGTQQLNEMPQVQSVNAFRDMYSNGINTNNSRQLLSAFDRMTDDEKKKYQAMSGNVAMANQIPTVPQYTPYSGIYMQYRRG